MQCVQKDIQSVSLENRAYGIIASKGVRIRISHRDRLSLLQSMWKVADQASIGRSAWFVLVVRQSLQRDDLLCVPVPADSACRAGVTFRLVGKLNA